MRRRELITLLGGAATVWPLAARAQQPEYMRRVGVLTTIFSETDSERNVWLHAFQDELQKLGWQQDRNLQFEFRLLGNNTQQLPSSAAELAAMRPDIILVAGSPALVVLARETQAVPIVFVQVLDPVKLGLVANLARPGGNITGFANFEDQIGGKWLALLKDAAPATSRVAAVFDPDNPAQPVYLQSIEAAAPSFGMQVTRAPVRNAPEIGQTITGFGQVPNGALVVVPNSVTIHLRKLIINLAAKIPLPAVYPYRFFAESGGLISYGVDLPGLYRLGASYVDRILRGAKPGNLPVQLASKFELVVNLKTAKALGLAIPEPFLQSADELIE
jgi:putative ABC transport system substrate-binding protein